MKKLMKRGLIALFSICVLVSNFRPVTASANEFQLQLTPYYVPDIDNVLYPSTSQYYAIDGIKGTAKFEITEPTIVKAYFNWDMTTTKNISGMAWFSSDVNGLDIIGSSVKLSKVGDNTMVFLDPGVYYINHYFNVKDSSTSSFLRVGVALLAENTRSTENLYVSSYYNPNNIKIDEPVRGFLSNSSPIDYYRFVLDEKSQVFIKYNFEQTDDEKVSSGVCTLYDSENQKLSSKNFNSSGADNNILKYMLEPGIYYISLSGAKCATSLEVESNSYEVEITPSTTDVTNEDVTLTVSTGFEPEQILYVPKEITNVKIKDTTIWNTRSKTCFEVELNSFTVTENGTYTVRLRDENNYYVLKTVKVSNIDKTTPKVKGVANNKTYPQNTVVKFSDAGSGINYATLNGKNFQSGSKITATGKMTLKVYDNAGNVATVKFTIKKQ